MQLLEARAHRVHSLRIVALLDDRGDECGELRRLPALRVAQFDMDEVQSLEGMILDDPAEHVSAAGLARVPLDRRALIHDMEFFFVRGDLELVDGWALTMKFAASEAAGPLLNTIVEQRVKMRCGHIANLF